MASVVYQWRRACEELSARDPVMAKIIAAHQHERLPRRRSDAFVVLARAIVGQQISVRAADSVWQRLTAHVKRPTPAAVSRCRQKTLCRCGLSQQKARYLKALATFFVRENVNAHYWRRHSYEVLRQRLLDIPGIGVWTFEMFAIFYLHHPNILPLGDLGLINAINRAYNRGRSSSRTRLLSLAKRWSPWCTVATWYLWRSIDGEAITY